jgi:hypothetical protein
MERDDGYLVVAGLRQRDPDGVRLRRMLQAQAAVERARRHRTRMVHLLAWLSAPLALVAVCAGAVPALREIVLAAWATATGGVAIATAAAWSYGRKCAALMVELESPGRRAP